MSELVNLVVELRQPFDVEPIAGIELTRVGPADERTLAWIDDEFGGSWSSEAYAGCVVVARERGAPVGFAGLDPKGLKFAWLGDLARAPDVGIFGPFGVAPQWRNRGLGILLLRSALNALRERGYARALLPAAGGEPLLRYYAAAAGARVAERFEQSALYRRGRRTLVMASGKGSNFQALLDTSRAGEVPVEIAALIVNEPQAFAIERARNAGVDTIIVPWDRRSESRAAHDLMLLEAARATQPDLVVLLGWMHLLSDAFVAAFPEMLNLHPAFLPLDPTRDDVVMPDGSRIPAFRGPRAVRDALRAGSSWVGATLHRVTSATDRGPVMTRKPLRVEPREEEEPLMERVHALERGVVKSGVTRWLLER